MGLSCVAVVEDKDVRLPNFEILASRCVKIMHVILED